MTEELCYKLNTTLIPLLSKNDEHIFDIKISVPTTAEVLQNAGAVGTGVSGGADSFHAILNTYDSKYKGLQLTHLCLFNVGSFKGNKRFQKDIYERCIERAEIIAQEFKLPLIISNSNLADVFSRNHACTHDYSSAFGICCLQKLWKSYYYASSCTDVNIFTLKNSSKNDSDVYAPLIHYCFNNYNLNIISEGMHKNKMEKLESIADSPVVQKYLHVCTAKSDNCSKCPKCKRTMLALDAIGKLDNFSDVFDIEYYNKNRFKYYWLLFKNHYHKVITTEDVYQKIKSKMTKSEFVRLKFLVALRYFIFDVTHSERKVYKHIKFFGINFKYKKR